MANEPALYARMEMRVAQAEKQMAKFAKQLDGQMGGMERRTNRAAKNMESSMSRGFAKMKGYAAEAGKGLWAGIAAGGVAGIAASIQTVAKSFADLGREAKTAGIGVEDFQKWRYVADQNRIGIDAMIDAFKELNIRGDEYIKTGKGGGADAFAQIGMSPDEVKTRLKDPSALMLEIIDRTKRLKNTAAGVRIFDELFGGQGGEQFTRLIDQGREGITATLREAEKMGPIVDENFIKRAEEVDKKFNQIATTIGTNVKGAIVEAVTALSGFISQWNALNEKSLSGMRAELDVLAKARERLNTTQPAGGFQDGVAGLFGQDRETQLKNIAAEEKKITDEMERRKNIVVRTPEQPPVKPYVPPKSETGRKGKSDEEKARDKAVKAADREREAVKKLIQDLEFEASLVGKTAVEKEKLIALRHAGAAATATEKTQIEALVESTFKQNEAWEKTQERLQEINDMGREFAGTLVSGMLNGASATDVLSDALGRLADRLLNSGLDALFGGGGGMGGLFGGLFGGGGFGTGYFPPIPGGGLYASGGYTGAGGKNDPAGIVHKGEVVWSQKDVARAGGVGVVEAMRRGIAGYSGGGVPGMPNVSPISAPRVPTMPSLAQTNNNTTNNAPVINVSVNGATGNTEVAAMVQQGVAQGIASWQQSSQFASAVSYGFKQGQKRGMLR